jgi:hypothetical protein
MLVACERNPVVPDESPSHRVPGRPLVDGTVIKNAATDYDGNIYDAVVIGKQVWMQSNLRTTHYADGTEIPLESEVTDSIACYYYDGDGQDIANYITSYAAWAILIIPTMPLASVHILPVFMGLSITAAILRALVDRLISGAPPSTRMLVLNRCRDANYPMPALLLMVLATVKDLVILSVVYAISLFCGNFGTLNNVVFFWGRRLRTPKNRFVSILSQF